MTQPNLTPLAASLPSSVPFVGPETQERARGRPFRARLGANESLFGPSPLAVRAMRDAVSDVWMYGDPENHALKAALAAHHGCRPENIVVGEGIDGLLGYLVRLFVAPGDPVVTSLGAYPTFNFHVTGYGGTLHRAPYKGWHEDPEALVMLEQASSRTNGDVDISAFIATLHQRAGRHAESTQRFQQVLAARPLEGRWWVGLAISLEAQQDWQAARAAYARAMNGASLTGELMRYAEQRMTALRNYP